MLFKDFIFIRILLNNFFDKFINIWLQFLKFSQIAQNLKDSIKFNKTL